MLFIINIPIRNTIFLNPAFPIVRNLLLRFVYHQQCVSQRHLINELFNVLNSPSALKGGEWIHPNQKLQYYSNMIVLEDNFCMVLLSNLCTTCLAPCVKCNSLPGRG